jgi:outer membrane biosynthesis protein TonB
MTRIFAPSTPDSFFRRDGIAVGLLIMHIVVLILVVAPPVRETTEQEILDRLVVFLVPPDDPAPREASEGESGYNAAASSGSGEGDGAVSPTSGPVIELTGDIPAIPSASLDLSRFANPEEDALTVLEVDSAVVREPTSAAPEYPAHLLSSGLQGHAEVRYVVDTLGFVDTLSYRVVKATHIDFAVAVRRALPRMRFRPALRRGIKVRQLVEQTFRFRITDPVVPATPPTDTAAPLPARQ